MRKQASVIVFCSVLITGLFTVAMFGSCKSTITSENVTVPSTETIPGIVPTPAETLWQNVPLYSDASQLITAKTGDEFAVGYIHLHDRLINFTVDYDLTSLTLMDKQWITYNDRTMEYDSVSWYLFKANKSGSTTITVNLFEHLVPTPIPEVFNITIS